MAAISFGYHCSEISIENRAISVTGAQDGFHDESIELPMVSSCVVVIISYSTCYIRQLILLNFYTFPKEMDKESNTP